MPRFCVLSSSQLLETEAAKRKPVGLASGGFCGFLEWPYFWGFRRLPEVPLLVNKKTSRVATGTHSNKHAACVGCRGHWGTPGADSSSRTVDPPHRCRWSTPAWGFGPPKPTPPAFRLGLSAFGFLLSGPARSYFRECGAHFRPARPNMIETVDSTY